jgi:hypothetical protein
MWHPHSDGPPDAGADQAWDQQVRHETREQQLDRNFTELLQELRVAQTGVQILLAFLLTMAFANRFSEVRGAALLLYLATVMLAALATCVLIGPVACHRLLFRRRAKARLMETAHRLTMVGLVLLALAIVGSISLVVQVSVGWAWTVVFATGTAVAYVLVWLVLPLSMREP